MLVNDNVFQLFVDGKSIYVKEWLSKGLWWPMETELHELYNHCFYDHGHHRRCLIIAAFTFIEVSKTVLEINV